MISSREHPGQCGKDTRISLTLDEVQSQLTEPLLSMNLDELLKSNFPDGMDADGGVASQSDPAPGLHLQGSTTMPPELSKKTVDEVWKDIQNSPKKSGEGGWPRRERQPTFEEMTLEEFLVRAGVVASEEGGWPRRERQPTPGEVTLEEFLVRAGVVVDGHLKDSNDLPANMDAVGSSVIAAAAPSLNPGPQWLQPYQQQTLDPQHGIEVLWNFYMEYKRGMCGRVDGMQREQERRMRESGTFVTEMGTMDVEMKKIYATLRALLEALEILVGEAPTHRLGRQILEEVEALEDMVSSAPSSLIKGIAAVSTTAVLSTKSPTATSPTQVAVQEVSQQETKQIESTVHHMPLQQLKKITNNFCHELGRGGCGVVYKGMLENGQIVAVKKLVQSMPSSQEQFENEVNLLVQLKHPNIARLVGYCYETQHLRMPLQGKFVFAENIHCLLCLEFLTNGSLDRYISDASSGFDWPTRCKIIEGISYGLQYLHEQSNDPIIHLDLKPANILLDENMVPKITDFGLSRLFDQNQTIRTEHASGTRGYMPPEYIRHGIITPMSDIFSLGVIIMEVITGHKEYPYDIRASSEDFIKLELKKWRNRLQKEPGYTSLETDCQQIERCLQIGLICVNPMRTRRPAMKKIIDMLQGLESMKWYISNELSSHDIQVDP